jgi:phage shock protein C
MIDGVCGGFAEYLGVQTVWIRIGWALLALAGGIGAVAYLLAMYLFPRSESEAPAEPMGRRSPAPLVAGVILLAVGILLVLRAVGVLDYGFWGAWDVAWRVLWPLCLVGGGLLLLLVYMRSGTQTGTPVTRPAEERMVMGVCAGLGRYLKVDANLLRFLFALLVVLSRGLALLVYVVLGLLTPEGERGDRPAT